MKNSIPVLIIVAFLCKACQPKQPSFETLLSINDAVIRSGQVDTAVQVLKKRLLLEGLRDATVVADKNNRQIRIQSPVLDKDWIRNYLLKKDSLVFYECYSIYDLSALLDDTAQQAPGTGVQNKVNTKKPLFSDFLEIAPPYMTPAGEQVLPGYIGYVLQENIPLLKKYFALKMDVLPFDMKILLREMPLNRFRQKQYEVYAVKENDRKFFANNHITECETAMDGTHPAVHMGFDAYGVHVWSRMTKANINKTIAIVIDDNVLSAPKVMGEIAGGKTEISGEFNQQEAQELTNLLRSGYLSLQIGFKSMEAVKQQ